MYEAAKTAYSRTTTHAPTVADPIVDVETVTSTHEPATAPLLLQRGFIESVTARALLHELSQSIEWRDSYSASGRQVAVPRAQAWVADSEVSSRYAQNLLLRLDWTAPLVRLRRKIESATAHPFNAVLLTWYRDGNDWVGYHADDDIELGNAPYIASLSLGTTRLFRYRSRQGGDALDMPLASGDLLLMESAFQHGWEHSVPPQPDITGMRINLTFRHVQC